MSTLAIKGHATRSKEVIEILEMLGGHNNSHNFLGTTEYNYYYIGNHNTISCIPKEKIDSSFVIFTIEEFIEKFPYKIGDRVLVPEYEFEVRINNMIWNGVEIQYSVFTDEVEWYSAEELNDFNNTFITMEDNKLPSKYYEETQSKRDMEKTMFMLGHTLVPKKINDKLEYEITDGYEFDRVDNNKIILKPVKPKYPKTYEECHELMVQWKEYDCNPNSELIFCDAPIHDFCKIIVARNLYWKIAGEQMGLDKPWEPDYSEEFYEQGCPIKYVIYYTGTHITKERKCTPSYVLSFPTEEMRDAFYENFKDLIEECKELL